MSLETVVLGAVSVASTALLGILAWSLRRNISIADRQHAETRQHAEQAADRAERASAVIAETVRREVAASGELTRGVVGQLASDVSKITAQLSTYGERLSAGNERFRAIEEKLAAGDAALADRVKDLEERERDRGCFGGCALARPGFTPPPR